MLLVMPCQTALDLHQVAIQTAQQNLADLAPVLVDLDSLDRDRLTGDHIGQALLRDIAECLPLFRRINSGHPYLVVDVGVVHDCNGVAIGHIDDLAHQGIGLHLKHQAQRQGSGRCFEYFDFLKWGFILLSS